MNWMGAPLILASASPRRSELLTRMGMEHQVVAASLDESVLPGEAPLEHVQRLAQEKGAAVARNHAEAWVLAGDTVVLLEDDILGKPRDEEQAVEMLLALAGREHVVATALALTAPGGAGPWVGVEETRVRFRSFDEAWAQAYVATGEPMDKAGAYGIQGLGGVLVKSIEGDYSNVVGLPIPLLVRLLDEGGTSYQFPGGDG